MFHPGNWSPDYYTDRCVKAVSKTDIAGFFAERVPYLAQDPPWVPDTPTYVMGTVEDGVCLMAQHFTPPKNPTNAINDVFVNMLDPHLQHKLQELAQPPSGRVLKLVGIRVVFWFSRSKAKENSGRR